MLQPHVSYPCVSNISVGIRGVHGSKRLTHCPLNEKAFFNRKLASFEISIRELRGS